MQLSELAESTRFVTSVPLSDTCNYARVRLAGQAADTVQIFVDSESKAAELIACPLRELANFRMSGDLERQTVMHA